MVGARVLGMTSDAGSQNSRLFRLLRNRLDVSKEGAWLPLDRIRTVNIYDPTRFIYLFHCTTHGDKSMRNQLFGSWSGGKGQKAFLSADGSMISKRILDECYQRDKKRASPRTRLNEAAINPDKWSKMNVSDSLKISESKTLAELTTHLYSEFSVPVEQQITPDKYKTNDGHVSGYYTDVADQLNKVVDSRSPLSTVQEHLPVTRTVDL